MQSSEPPAAAAPAPLPSSSPSTGPIYDPATNQLTLADRSFVAAPGHATRPLLKGVNLVGNERYLHATTWPTAPGLAALQTAGFNTFRIVTRWENLQPDLGGPLDQSNADGLTTTVERIARAGGVAIIDFHNSMRRKTRDADDGMIVGQSAVTAALFADGWVRVARLFKDNPNVVFNLSNEPHDQDVSTLADSYNEVIAAIRNAGARNPILLDGNNYSDAATWSSGPNGSALLTVSDPADNLVFAPHLYFDGAGGTRQECRPGTAIDPANLGAPTAWARKHGKRLFLGEFGASTQPACLSELIDALTFLAANRDVWIGSAYFGAYAGQPPFHEPDEFFYALDPRDSAGTASGSRLDPRLDLLAGQWNETAFRIDHLDRKALKAWYRPHTATGDRWPDSSPNGADFVQPDPRRRPQPARDGGLSFDAGGFMDNRRASSGPGAGEESVYAVVTLAPGCSSPVRLLQPIGVDGGRELSVTALGQLRVVDQGVAELYTSHSRLRFGRKQLIVLEGGRRGADLRGGFDSAIDTEGYGERGYTGTSGVRLGPFGDGSCHSTVHELVVTKNDLPRSQKLKIIARLMWDHGLQELLPEDFPFKVVPPIDLVPAARRTTPSAKQNPDRS